MTELNQQRRTVFLDRYALKGPDGQPVETEPSQMWGRVARGLAVDEQQEASFRAILDDFKFLPGGRILSGAGTDSEVTMFNCYVIPVETKSRRRNNAPDAEYPYAEFDTGNDSREAIIDTIGVMVDIMTRGGGVGINWSVLRPAGAHLKRINATSSGPIDWMHFASVAVGTVEQGGSRRGAAMFMLDDWHPNVLDFINAKRDLTRITNANISVAVSDRFMEALAEDGYWDLVFPDTADPDYDRLWDGDLAKWQAIGKDVKVYETVRARDLWRQLAEAAWDNGEPGVVFLDRYNKQSTGRGVERIISVNPCGEQGLGPYSVCNLGAMNLAAYIRNETGYSPSGKSFDWGSFERDVQTAVRFLDRVIDENHYFLPENEKVQKDLRRIGLGVMGLADALILLGLRYGSPEAVAFTEDVFRTLKHAAISESALMAKESGPAPMWDRTMLARPYIDDLNIEPGGSEVYEMVSEHGLRNLFLLTQAPTGTTSILAGVNSGIEPFFALGYWREDRTGKHWVQPDALSAIDSTEPGSLNHVVTADEVTVEEHIAMQAAAQKYIDSSVSKTINAPNSHTVEDVERAYTLAYEAGLKGLAYFRDGCGRAQVLSTESSKPTSTELEDARQHAREWEELAQGYAESLTHLEKELDGYRKQPGPWTRPESLVGRTHKTRAGTQTAYVTVNRDNDRPVEVFVSVGKSGTGIMEMGEALGRLASIGLQQGLNLGDLIDQLDGVGNNGVLNRSLPSAIAAALRADIEAHAHDEATVNEFMTEAAKVLQSSWGPETDEDFIVQHNAYEPSGAIVGGVDLGAEGGDKTVTVAWDKQGNASVGDLCPDCGSFSLIREEGCKKCHACGYSAC